MNAATRFAAVYSTTRVWAVWHPRDHDRCGTDLGPDRPHRSQQQRRVSCCPCPSPSSPPHEKLATSSVGRGGRQGGGDRARRVCGDEARWVLSALHWSTPATFRTTCRPPPCATVTPGLDAGAHGRACLGCDTRRCKATRAGGVLDVRVTHRRQGGPVTSGTHRHVLTLKLAPAHPLYTHTQPRLHARVPHHRQGG